MKALELFCGIGGFRLATDRLGIETVWANDINPLASVVYRSKFNPQNHIEGNIFDLFDAAPAHDLLTAGFPCQPFSAAGKKQGIADPRGTLFEAIVRILSSRQPRYFVLENVKRLISMDSGTHFATILASLAEQGYMVEWRVLNAKDFGLAQNRERIFIIGTRVDDVFAHGADIRHLLRLLRPGDATGALGFSRNLLRRASTWPSIHHHGTKFANWGVALNGRFVMASVPFFSESQPTVLLHDILEKNPPPEYDLTETTLPRLANNSPVNKFVGGVEILSNQAGGARMGYTIFGVNGLSPTLTASTSRHYERYKVNESYRRLTPIEYARLQGFPDNHCSIARPYDQYTLYGNAAPPQMVEWVIRQAISEQRFEDLGNEENQGELFNAE